MPENFTPFIYTDQTKRIRQDFEAANMDLAFREWFKNVLEMAEGDPARTFHAHVGAGTYGSGVEKLVLSDDGYGMPATSDDLFVMSLDAFTSRLTESVGPGKTGDNQGRGFRMMWCGASPHGFDVYTKEAGAAGGNRALVRYSDEHKAFGRDGNVGLKPYDAGTIGIVDFTDPAASGTTFVIKGHASGDNTFHKPFPNVRSDRPHVAHYLFDRFFRFGRHGNVELKVSKALGQPNANWPETVRPIEEGLTGPNAIGAVKHYKVVTLPSGIKLHWAYLDSPRIADKGMVMFGPIDTRMRGGVVWRDEIMDFAVGNEWEYELHFLGDVDAIAANLILFIELPDDFPVRHSPDRTKLYWKGHVDRPRRKGRGGEVHLRNFKAETSDAAHWPAFIAKATKEKLQKLSDDEEKAASKAWLDLFKDFAADLAKKPVPGGDEDGSGSEGGGQGGGHGSESLVITLPLKGDAQPGGGKQPGVKLLDVTPGRPKIKWSHAPWELTAPQTDFSVVDPVSFSIDPVTFAATGNVDCRNRIVNRVWELVCAELGFAPDAILTDAAGLAKAKSALMNSGTDHLTKGVGFAFVYQSVGYWTFEEAQAACEMPLATMGSLSHFDDWIKGALKRAKDAKKTLAAAFADDEEAA